MFNNLNSNRLPLILSVLLLAVLVRVGFILFYPPRTYPDTTTYVQAGKQFTSGNYENYTGRRTPVYPLFLAAVGNDFHLAMTFQMVMGVGIVFLLYLMFSLISGSANLGLLAGLSYALNPSQLLSESTIGNETLCTLLLTMTIYYAFKITDNAVGVRWRELFLLGFFSGLCILTRPQYQILVVLVPLYLALIYRNKFKWAFLKPAVFLIPVLSLMLGWMSFQNARINQFVMTPDLGHNIMNHAVKFIEYAPDKFDRYKEILIRNREHKLRTKGETYSTVGMTYDELYRTSDLSYLQITQIMGEMAVVTIKEKPLLYLGSVSESLTRFFKPYWPGRLWGIRDAVTRGGGILKLAAATYAIIHLACMFIFLIYPLAWIFLELPRSYFKRVLPLIFIYLLVFTTALSQAMVEYGENARYKTSVEPLMIAVAVVIVYQTFTRCKEKNSSSEANS